MAKRRHTVEQISAKLREAEIFLANGTTEWTASGRPAGRHHWGDLYKSTDVHNDRP